MTIHIKPDDKEVLSKAIEKDLAILLVGDTGCGKTATIRELAKESGKELVRINLTGQTGVDDIIGKFLVNEKGTYWIDGLLIGAMKRGDWIVLDEINMALPEILSKLHSLLDDDRKIVLNEKDGEIVKPAEGFRLFATMNPSDDYAGTKELNLAFLSRFGAVLQFDYAETEAEIVAEQGGVEVEMGNILVSIAKEARQCKKDGKLSYIVSTRDMIYCASLIKQGLTPELAVETSIINKYPESERVAVGKLFALITDGKIKIKTKDGKKEFKGIQELAESLEELGNSIEEKDKTIKEKTETIDKIEKEKTLLEKRVNGLMAILDEKKPEEKALLEKVVRFLAKDPEKDPKEIKP